MKFTQPCIIPVINATTTSPPASPAAGDTYLCLSGSGSWITGNVAQYNGATWDYTTLVSGTVIYNIATGLFKESITGNAATVTGLTFSTGKTLAVSNILTLAGVDSTTITFQGTDTYVGRATTDTLTNKRITERLASTASTSTPTPAVDTTDEYILTALAVGATFGVPTGSPTQGQVLIIRIKDNGTAQTLAWTLTTGGYRAVGCTLPTTTVLSKVLYIACVYNNDETIWDVVGVCEQ